MTPLRGSRLNVLSVFLSLVLLVFPCSGADFFNLTAIAARDGKSLFQCWQLSNPLSVSATAGIVGAAIQQLGQLGAAEYDWLPAHYPGTAHPAPVPQYVIFLSGRVRISMPESSESHVFIGGKHAILFADDTAAKSETGHVSSVLHMDLESVILPTANGAAPPHSVLYDGVCQAPELTL
ncbi:hypothetical protein MMC27_003771 [Xylographa pallens]|nr:hypothetical protein [Xylographa pallens]